MIGLGDCLPLDANDDVEIGGRDGDGVAGVHDIAQRCRRPGHSVM